MSSITLITGGSRGLGKNTALALAKDGNDVILTYNSNKHEADKVVTEITALGQKACAFQLDLTETKNLPEFIAKLKTKLHDIWQRKSIDNLVNNAGHGEHAPVAEITEMQFDGLINVHLKGMLFLTQAVLPIIADKGKIINISTGLTRFSLPGFAAYASIKSAVETLSVYMAKEFGNRGITVNTVAPGAIETDFGGGVVRDNIEINKMIAKSTALGRVGRPDDIGPMIAGLLKECNRWVNGQRIEVSGGQNL